MNLRKTAFSLLRKSESIFKTDMVYAAKGGFWLTFGQIISTLSSFLLAIAFANLLSQETYGTYRYLLSLAGIIGSISLSGLGAAMTRSVSKGFEGSFLQSFYLNLRWSILMAVSAAFGALYYFLNENNTLAIGMIIIGCFSPLLDSGELYNSYLNGKKLFKEGSLMRSLRSVVTSLIIFITLVFSKNPLVILFVYFLTHTITVCVLFLATYRFFKPNNLKDEETIRLGKHTSFMNFLAAMADRIDNILVFHYLGPIQLAIYNFALLIPNNVSGILKNIGILAIPKFAKVDVNTGKIGLIQKSFYLLIITLPIVVVYIFIAPFIFKVFFPTYVNSIIYSQVFALIILISGVLPSAFLDANVAIKEKYIVNIIGNSIKVIIIFIGIYYAGVWGAIISRIIAKIINVSLGYIAVFKVKSE